MKDSYGVANAIQMALTVLENASVQTGRTTRMLTQLKDGDTVLCASERECEYLRRKWRDIMSEQLNPIQGVTFQAVRFYDNGIDLDNIKPVSGNVHFDHQLIDKIYRQRIEAIGGTLDMISTSFSGKGSSHPVRRLQERS